MSTSRRESSLFWVPERAAFLEASQGEKTSTARYDGVPLPTTQDVEVSLEPPRRRLVEVRCEVRAHGRAIPLKGLKLRLYVRAKSGTYKRIGVAKTDTSGESVFSLPPGRYKAVLDPTRWRAVGKEFRVDSSGRSTSVILEIG